MSAKIGVKNLHYAVMTAEDEAPSTAPTYGSMKDGLVGKTVNISVNVETADADIYADDMKYDTASEITGITISLTAAEIPIEVQGELLGHTVTKGVMDSDVNDVAPWVGLAFEFTKRNGKKRFVKLYKGRFKEVNEQGETKGSSVSFQTEALEGSFLPLKNSGVWKKTADEEGTGYEDTTGTAWYTAM